MALHIELNGQRRELTELNEGDSLQVVIAALDLKGDRIAVEKNGEIVPRSTWPETLISNDDKLEMVHFVGGGCAAGTRIVGLAALGFRSRCQG